MNAIGSASLLSDAWIARPVIQLQEASGRSSRCDGQRRVVCASAELLGLLWLAVASLMLPTECAVFVEGLPPRLKP